MPRSCGYGRIRWIKFYYVVYILKQWNNYVKIKLSIKTKYVQLFNFIWLFLKEKAFQGRPRNSFQHILFCHTYHKVLLEFSIKTLDCCKGFLNLLLLKESPWIYLPLLDVLNSYYLELFETVKSFWSWGKGQPFVSCDFKRI